MSPSISKFNMCDGDRSNAVIFGYLPMKTGVFTNGSNIICCEFGIPVFFTSSAPIFMSHILHIGRMTSGPKMVRVYARWVVTRMADIKSFWDSAFIKFIGDAMGWFRKTVLNIKKSIAHFVIFTAFPDPTAVKSFFKETLKAFLKSTLHQARVMAGNKSNRLTLFMSKLGICFCGDRCEPIATTFA